MNLRNILPLLVILLAPPAMMYPLWSNPVSAGEDDILSYYPQRAMVGRELAAGRLPLANPLEATGGVVFADPQAAVMHPTTWLFAVLPAKPAYAISIFTAFWLAGLGTYFYLRRLGLVRTAACFGAVAFMLGGFFVGHRVHLSMILTAGMLPWGLLAVELLRNKILTVMVPYSPASNNGVCEHGTYATHPFAAFAVATLVFFLALAAGSWPTLVNLGLIWGVYVLLRGRPFVKTAAIVAAAGVLACIAAGPQLFATQDLLAQATRQKLGFSTAGENSFFPPAAVLALYPMLLGCRTPNFFTSAYWGPWHLCEMLGYVGLLTLGLAGACVWRCYRKPRTSGEDMLPQTTRKHGTLGELSSIVRVWTWLAIGGGVWMLGYYLPPLFKVIHALPVLGVVRCPARMVLLVDLALATLAAVAIHVVSTSVAEGSEGLGERAGRLARTICRVFTFWLPGLMIVTFGAVYLVANYCENFGFWQFFVGQLDAIQLARRAAVLDNPAVYVPLILAVVSALAVRFWLGGRVATTAVTTSSFPRLRRSAVLVVVLLADLFFIARFVDMPVGSVVAPDPEVSPAAAWLKVNAPNTDGYLVYGLSSKYFNRPAELLLPNTANHLGVATLAGYGPFRSPRHAQLLGFDTSGYNRDWPGLLRQNSLLSLYGVRYVIVADKDFRDVIESVRIGQPVSGPTSQPARVNLLTDNWELDHVGRSGDTLSFRSDWMWQQSAARQPVALTADAVYRISLDARGPDVGAANYLRAEVQGLVSDKNTQWGMEWDATGLSIRGDEIGPDWRHFEWTFRTPPAVGDDLAFKIHSVSERPIEVRNVSLCQSRLDEPFALGGRRVATNAVATAPLKPGDDVYRKVAELPAMNAGAPPVAIYENMLWSSDFRSIPRRKMSAAEVERVKWDLLSGRLGVPAELPDVSLSAPGHPRKLLLAMTLPAGLVFVGVVVFGAWRRGRSPCL